MVQYSTNEVSCIKKNDLIMSMYVHVEQSAFWWDQTEFLVIMIRLDILKLERLIDFILLYINYNLIRTF